MTTEEFAAKARRHWAEWLPETTARLRASGQFETAVRAAAQRAHKEMQALMRAGYQAHEAEEVVLAEHVYLQPETDGLSDALAAELADNEAEYQETQRALAEIDRKFDAME